MITSLPIDSREARLAGWASSALASSFLLVAIVLLAIVGASDPLEMLREHPVGVLGVAATLDCYVVSFVCLYKIRRRTEASSDLLWGVSLLAACVPIVAVIYWLGFWTALVVCFFEVIAVAIHVFVLADV
jgi:hypothetical protein